MCVRDMPVYVRILLTCTYKCTHVYVHAHICTYICPPISGRCDIMRIINY